MESKKERRLKNYLNQGRIICGSRDFMDDENKHRTILACIRVNNSDFFEVDIEEYYSSIDIDDLDIRKSLEVFQDLSSAISFIEIESGICFREMNVA